MAAAAGLTMTASASAALSSVGPVDPSNNFPSYYKDANGVALQICQDGLPNCLAGPELLQDVHAAGGDAEAFYWAADATTAHFVLHDALEAAYAADGPDQEVVFQRTQVTARAGGLRANTPYRVTDPYGTFTCTTNATGTIAQNGCRLETTPVPASFAPPLAGRMGPFLTWDTYGAPAGAPPAGYIGDNTTPHKVVGSPTGFNAFRVEGPDLTGTCTNADGSTVSNCEQTDLFVVQGKVQPGASAIVTPTGPVDFGNIPVSPVTKTLTYTSTGSENVTIASIGISGTNAADFAVTPLELSDCNTALGIAPGSSCTLDVTFTPRANAASTATLSIVDSTGDVARTITLKGSSKPVTSIEPATSSLAFGSVPVTLVSAEDNVVVSNDGPVPATIDVRTITGTGASHFKLGPNNTCNTPVPPGEGCEIGVQFAPTTTGAKTARLELTDSGGTKLPAVPLSGTGLAAPVIAAPTVNPASGAYTSAQSVTMSAAAGTTIRYTVGTGTTVPADPTASTGTVYSGAVTVDASQVIKARAFDANGVASPVVQRNFTINLPPAAPTVNPASGTFTAAQSVTMTSAAGTTIRYTVGNGTTAPADPTATTGTVYSGPVSVSSSQVIKAAAFSSADVRSAVVTRTYAINPAAPTVTPASGTFTTAQSVAMTAAAGTTIRYTVGTGTTVPADPTATTGTLYSTPVNVDSSQIIKARAFDANGAASTVVQRTYTINLAPAAPTVTPASGTFTTAQSVAMTAAAGTTIRYTVGTGTTVPADPTAATGTLYSAPVSVSASQVIKAAAFSSAGVRSAVVQRNYTISAPNPAPTVTARTPAANALGISQTANLTATFSEAVTGVSGTTFTLKNAAGTAIAATATYNATTRVATLDPTATLANDTKYTATLTTAIKDAAGNPIPATTWTFTTGPRPTVTARTPAVNATAVSRTANVTATFSEAVTGVTATTATVKPISATGTLGTAVAAVVSRNGTTNQWIINPSVTLAASSRYRVDLTAGIRDVIGNPMTALNWTFTTGA